MTIKNTKPGSESLEEQINRNILPIDVTEGGVVSTEIKGVLDGMTRQLEGIIHLEVLAPKSPSDDR
jgi:hypothetical protein